MSPLDDARAQVGASTLGVSLQAIVELGRGGAETDSEELNALLLDRSPALVRALVLNAVFEVFAPLRLRHAGAVDLVREHLLFDEGGDLRRELYIRACRTGEVDTEGGGRELHRGCLHSTRGLSEARPDGSHDGIEEAQRERGRGLLHVQRVDEAQEPDGLELPARRDGGSASVPAGTAKASAWRQSPATNSRLAGVGRMASFMKAWSSLRELAGWAKTWAARSSVRMRDQAESVSRTVKTLTACAAAWSAALREMEHRGRKAITA